MSEENKRTVFVAMISFMAPQNGSVQIPAFDKDHAKELAAKILEKVDDGQIIDVFALDELEDRYRKALEEQMQEETPEVVN